MKNEGSKRNNAGILNYDEGEYEYCFDHAL